MNKLFTIFLSFLLIAQGLCYGENKFKAKLSGRMHLDGSFFVSGPDTLSNRLDIVDLRLAGKVSYGDWSLKLDVGFANQKLRIKDAFMQYKKDDNYFRLGYMLGFFSTDQSASTNDFTFNTGANAAETFYPGRRTGISYTLAKPKAYVSAGLFVGDRINTDTNIKPGYNGSIRALWRPYNREDFVFHVGLGGFYRVPDMDMTTGLRKLSIGSKGVTYTTCPQFQRLDVTDVRNQYEGGAELYFAKKKWMFQAEYMYMGIDRYRNTSFGAHGGYLQAGYLIRGNHYGYDNVDALPTMPTDKGSLLLLLRFNMCSLNDSFAGLFGGMQQDMSIGLNYYFNEYISTRLNYSFIRLKDGPLGNADINQIQARLQFKF